MAEFVDKHVESIADVIRETLASSPWVPESLRPPPPPPMPTLAVPVSSLERFQNWISRHKILAGIIVVATGTVVYKAYRSSVLSKKSRKAKRAPSGGRLEVVVIAGSPALPLTRSLSLDFERKGFLVYVVTHGHEDEAMVQKLSRPDIRALNIDITDVSPGW